MKRQRKATYSLTPLMRAAAIGHVGGVREFIKEGEEVDAIGPRESTALMFAAGSGHYDVVKELIERGADPRLREAGGWSALDLAGDSGDREIIEYLAAVEKQAPFCVLRK